jgi:transketolase
MLRDDPKLIEKAVHTIQMLAVDGVEKAQSGHPGTPMALAGITLEIWLRHLRYDPQDPHWPGRDRFILSCGHASMLLYSMLHLAGYDLPMEELKRFRQWGSKTPGHPESHLTPGVEVTTGPLGQGISNAVGVACGVKMLAARFNQGAPLFTGKVYGIASDGDLMEGVSAEAGSLAGHLGLDNLIFFYDDNHITIDGKTDLAFSEDVGKRYEAYGWFVQHIDGHDHAQIRAALDKAEANKGKPSLIVARTHIGIGSPKQDSSKAHGEPLGPDAVKATKQKLGWTEETFYVPDDVRALFAERAEEGKKAHEEWNGLLKSFQARGGELPALYEQMMTKHVPDNLFEELLKVVPQKDAATRVQSGIIEQRVAALVPSFVGGSADLNPSTKTYIEGSPAVAAGKYDGRNIHFGIREHAMGSFVNGLASMGSFIPFGSTFLVFSDYMRPAVRLAALSHLQSLFVYTHDSVYLGEDGPTHQPVEHFWALRLIPNLDFFRPCDALECAAAWTHAVNRKDGPTAFALSRQKLANLPRPAGFDPKSMLRGAYVIAEAEGGKPTLVILATGSEVEVAVGAKKILDQKGEKVRVVSAPCVSQFGREPADYRESVLPTGVPRVAVEIGVSEPWYGIVGTSGLVIGHDDFGASAPDKDLQKHFGFEPDAVAAKIQSWRAATKA